MNADGRRLAITGVSGLYLGTAAWGTWVAVRDGMAGRPFGWDLGMDPLPGFFVGLGTALSAPLVLLIALVAANVMLHMKGRPARFGLMAVSVLGAGFVVGMLAEPVTWAMLGTGRVDGLVAGVVITNIVLPMVLILLAIGPRSQRQKTAIPRQPAGT